MSAQFKKGDTAYIHRNTYSYAQIAQEVKILKVSENSKGYYNYTVEFRYNKRIQNVTVSARHIYKSAKAAYQEAIQQLDHTLDQYREWVDRDKYANVSET